MNWDAIGAIGELLGSIAVVVTLLYLVRQLKSTEIATLNSTQSSIQLGRVTVNSQRFDHLDLVLRANKGEQLSDLEYEQLKLLYQNEGATMFFTYLNFRRLGEDGTIQAFNLARFLFENPGMMRVWRAENDKWPAAGALQKWRDQVNEQLELLLNEEK